LTTSSIAQPSLESTRVEAILNGLSAPNQAFTAVYPGESARRQPVHSVYGGAQLFTAETTPRLGAKALEMLHWYAPDPLDLGRAVGLPGCEHVDHSLDGELAERMKKDPAEVKQDCYAAWLAHTIYRRVEDKLKREPVEDYRIDFEDGYGNRPDAEEDGHAASTAREVARAMKEGTLPPYIGIRIKPFSEECKRRSVRTTDIFISELVRASDGKLPDNFVVTIPKVTVPAQAAALADLLDLLEQSLKLAQGSLKFEIMVETPQSIISREGRSPLLAMVEAGRGRCVAAHFGTYDYTASCQITAAYQMMDHPACMFALNMLKVSLIGTGLFLSDGATNIMPVPVHKGDILTPQQERENRQSVYHAWRLHYSHIQNSLRNGYFQGWDLHPGQLPTRYAAVYAFFLESLDGAADRLKNFVERAAQATLLGDVFDDAATGQALLNYFLRAINSGAVSEAETVERTGLSIEELQGRSFLAILKNRSRV
jgi:citrate lyase beta subunit